MIRKTIIPALLMMGLPVMTIAHSGHGAFHGHELWHYLLSPAHAIPVAIAIAILIFFYGRYKGVKQKQHE